MKIIYNNIIPLKEFDAMNIFGVIFARKEYGELPKEVINHERIHTAQMKELLYIPYYIIYRTEYLYNLCKYKNSLEAYDNISFEKEAYLHENDLEYCKTRKHYAQWRD